MAEEHGGRPHPAIQTWAERVGIAGGVLSLLVGALVTCSVLGRKFLDAGVPGDFEFVQMGTAVSVFFFLPACQARRGNIIVDTFTGWMSDAVRNRVDAFWDVVYGVTMGFLGYCMVLGSWDAQKTHLTTMVTQLPVWPALAISTLLLFFLALVSFWTAHMLVKGR